MRQLSGISMVAVSLILGSSLVLSSGMANAKSKGHKDGIYNYKSYKDEAPKIRKKQKARRKNNIELQYNDYTYANPKHNRWNHIRRNHNTLVDNGCIHPRKIRRRLIRQGWHDFKIVRTNRFVVRAKATNYRGRRFMLRIDRCDGYIISRRPMYRFWR